MDCGIPFCHEGCPLGNLIPEWNDLVWRGQWEEAAERLHATNNFPEFTGRLCPAPCEGACVLGINAEPVTIERVEYEIAERAFSERLGPSPGGRERHRPVRGRGGIGAVRPRLRPAAGPGRSPGRGLRTRRKPRGAAALRDPRVQDGEGGARSPAGPAEGGRGDLPLRHRRRGHRVRCHGVRCHWGGRRRRGRTGRGPRARDGQRARRERRGRRHAAGRSSTPWCWPVGPPCRATCPFPDATLAGVHGAMEYLKPSNLVREGAWAESPISAQGKNVVIIGGGDTGADCLGTAHRQGAASVHQLEILPRPPQSRPDDNPWPTWPLIYRTSSAHEEGGERVFAVTTTAFVDDGSGPVRALAGHAGGDDDGRRPARASSRSPGSEFELDVRARAAGHGLPGHRAPRGGG